MKKMLCCFTALLVLTTAARSESVGDLVKDLQSTETGKRREAAKKLGELGKESKPALAELIRALGDKDKFVRRFSAQEIGNLGEDGKPGIEALQRMFSDEEKQVVEAAVASLGKIGPDAAPALGSLAGNEKVGKDMRRDICETLVNMKNVDAAKVVVPLLTKMLKDKDQDIRMDAIKDLGKFGATSAPAVPQLIDMLKKGDRNSRQSVIGTLSAIGAEAKPAIPALKEIAASEKDEDKNLKKPAEDAIKKLEAAK